MQNRKKSAAISLFFGAVILFNFPLIGLSDTTSFFGTSWPSILIYLLVGWVLIILGVYRLNRNDRRPTE